MMDFLTLELLRQKRALAALLLGEQPDSTELQRKMGPRLSPEPLAESASERLFKNSRNPSPSTRRYAGNPEGRNASTSFGAALSEALGQDRDALLQMEFDGAASVRRLLSPEASGASSEPWRGTDNLAGSTSYGWREIARKPAQGFDAASGDGQKAAEPASLEMARGAGVPSDGPASSAMAVLQAGSFTAVSAGTDLAAAMSLAFQRDARRYDGGFLSS